VSQNELIIIVINKNYYFHYFKNYLYSLEVFKFFNVHQLSIAAATATTNSEEFQTAFFSNSNNQHNLKQDLISNFIIITKINFDFIYLNFKSNIHFYKYHFLYFHEILAINAGED
jgi:hypothetical protein